MARERAEKQVDVPKKLLSFLAGIEDVLDFAAVADQEIKDTGVKNKKEADTLNTAFPALRPRRMFFGKDMKVYRHHCKELIRRVLRGESLEPATEAEVMLALSAMSLEAPLQQDPAALYSRLFQRVFGDLDLKYDMQETYPGACDELLGKMRHKLRARRAT